jgi:uncharacterized protein (TIGR03118 family)
VQRGIRLAGTSLIVFTFIAWTLAAAGHAANDNSYQVTLLASNIAGEVPAPDAKLVNAWGIAANATSPWWVSNNGSNSSTLYNAAGTKIALEVNVPGAPTGMVAYPVGGTQFVVTGGSARFIWATEGGTILGWRTGANADVKATVSGAIFKGLAIFDNTLYATDFSHCGVQAFDGTFTPIPTDGEFFDDSIPSDYCPFGIQAIGGSIFVTYALRGGLDDVAGVSHGFVREFDTDGHLLWKVAQHGTLNSPWGLAMAPSNFGKFSSCLLVGNFGDGLINAYCLVEGVFRPSGRLQNTTGGTIRIDGLWGIGFGNGAAAGLPNVLYFAAGPDDESNGRFGKIAFVQ